MTTSTTEIPLGRRADGPAPSMPPRRTRGGVVRRLLRSLSSVLMLTGTLLLVDAILTVVWQEPLSALYASRQQGSLADQLKTLEQRQLNPQQAGALDRLRTDKRRIAFLARTLLRESKPGEPIGRIRMRRIDVDSVIVAGTDTATLRKGPGHYPDTPLPGMPGTVGIAGHRTTYGAPFRKVDKLRKDDRIELLMPYGRFVYEVERTRIVPPTAVEVTKRVSFDRLILSACHPLYSAAKRIVVFARLVEIEPRGAALVGEQTARMGSRPHALAAGLDERRS